jgi:hypothetical protein
MPLHALATFPHEKIQELPLLAAFLIGYFPDAGFAYLMQKVPQLALKRRDPDAAAALRALPIEIVDGIDSQVAFRLAEREITDIENLATQNAILLATETPYSLLQVIDWIAQAQLALEVGPKTYRELRQQGFRTIFTLEAACADPGIEALALKILYTTDRPASLKSRMAAMKASLHVQRLDEVYRMVNAAVAPSPGRTGNIAAASSGPIANAYAVIRAVTVDTTEA